MLGAQRVDPAKAPAYNKVMDLSPVHRRTVALVAAYAVALQMLFAAFVPPSLATTADGFAVLCFHDVDAPGSPVQHDVPCAAMCAAMGQGIAGPLPSGTAVSVRVPSSIAAPIPASDWVPPRIAATDNHAPRGPPLA
jgi:hypothetical protein